MSTIQANRIQTLAGQTMGTVLQSQFASSDALTSTTSQSGFVVMTAFLTPYFASSRILIMSSLYGSGDDDTNGWLEYQIGGGAWTRDSLLNGTLNGGSAFCDFSITRAVGEKSIQICGSTQLLVSFNTTSPIGIRVIGSAENTGGFYLNCGITQTAGSYNNISSKSTLVLMEIAQ